MQDTIWKLPSRSDPTTTTSYFPHNGQRRTVDDCYRQGKPADTIAYVASVLGMFDVGYDEEAGLNGYYWLEDLPIVWMSPKGDVNIDLVEMERVPLAQAAKVYQIIGWCVVHRIPCVLHGETSCRRAWRP